MRASLVLVVLSLASVLPVAAPASAQTPAVPPEGPDVPTVTQPAAAVDAFVDERFSFEETAHTRTIDVPSGTFDRVMLQFSGRPDGDPWDRLFGVALGGVEVMRGTTPRAPFTVRKDVTEFASLLPSGGTANVSLFLSTFVGAQLGSVRLEFYTGEPAAPERASSVAPAILWRISDGVHPLQSTVALPDEAPQRAVVELTLSGHGNEEFWYRTVRPRIFHVLVDSHEVATAVAMPYVYALLGFAGSTGTLVHPVMWWSAHQALDAAGVHTGVGEIPPYRAEVAAADLQLLRGARTVEVVQEGGGPVWWTSLAFALTASPAA
jgi:hypothetical protein